MQDHIQLHSVHKGGSVKSEVTPLDLDLSEVTQTCCGFGFFLCGT